jgi:hypothetical protein
MYKTIKYLYPNAEDSDFQLRDDSDGNGVYLDFWNENKLGAKPEMSFIISKMKETKILIEAETAAKAAQRQALLERLGITADEAKLLLS